MTEPVVIDVADELAEARELIDSAEATACEAVVLLWRAGRVLAVAKAATPHGEWLPALAAAGIDQRRASEGMRLAQRFASADELRGLTMRKALEAITGRRPVQSTDTSVLSTRVHAGPRARVELHTAAAADMLDVVAPGTVDAVVTDPAYSIDYARSWYDLGLLAGWALRPGGQLVAMMGKGQIGAYLAAVYAGGLVGTMRALSCTPEDAAAEWRYRWMVAVELPGANPRVWERSADQAWKPFVMHERRNGNVTPRRIYDFMRAKPVGPDHDLRQYHHWGQQVDIFERVIDAVTDPGDLVLDPFIGGGTTALACQATGRDIIASDVDPACIETTAERLGLSGGDPCPSATAGARAPYGGGSTSHTSRLSP